MQNYDPTNVFSVLKAALDAHHDVVEHTSFSMMSLAHTLKSFNDGEVSLQALADGVRFFLQDTENQLTASAEVGMDLADDYDNLPDELTELDEEDKVAVDLEANDEHGNPTVTFDGFAGLSSEDLGDVDLEAIYRDDPRTPMADIPLRDE